MCLAHDLAHFGKEFGIVHHAYFPRLLVLSVGGVDTAIQYLCHHLARYKLVLVLTDAATCHDGLHHLVLVLFCVCHFLVILRGACHEHCHEGGTEKNIYLHH